MKTIYRSIMALTALSGSLVVLHAAASGTYRVLQKLAIPGEGGWDYLMADAAGRRLYISHGTQVDVLDMDQNKVVGHIANTPGVHGIALSPDRGFTSNGKEGTMAIFDLRTLSILARVSVGENPDTILYDPASKHVFTFNGRSQDVTAVDPATAQVVGRLPLGGKPEFAVVDGSGMMYDDLEDQSQLAALETRGLTVKARWPVAPCEGPSSLAMDIAHRRLFAGCGNRTMAVVDADNGHVITTLPIGDHVDATVFDPETALIFNSNGDGTLTIIHEDSPNEYHVVENVITQKGARTMALDSKTHRLFLATAQFGPAPAATAEHPHPRPAILPGTFTLLVVAPQGDAH
jgi:YVTN family beta-propeller protein